MATQLNWWKDSETYLRSVKSHPDLYIVAMHIKETPGGQTIALVNYTLNPPTYQRGPKKGKVNYRIINRKDLIETIISEVELIEFRVAQDLNL